MTQIDLTFAFHSLLCIALCREAIFSSSLKHLPNHDRTVIGSMHPFFRILADIQRLHQQEIPDLQDLWSASCDLHDRLQIFWLIEDCSSNAREGDQLDMGTVCKCFKFHWRIYNSSF